jgi:GcrA cell cycle regulator
VLRNYRVGAIALRGNSSLLPSAAKKREMIARPACRSPFDEPFLDAQRGTSSLLWLQAKGLSASQIAEQLGTTRSAVLGRSARLRGVVWRLATGVDG